MKLKTFVLKTSNSIKAKIRGYLLQHHPSFLKMYQKIHGKVFVWRLRWQGRNKYPRIVQLKVGSVKCKLVITNRFEEFMGDISTSEPLFETFVRNIREDDVVFDIGAGPGQYSAFSSKIAKITYAFDCFPERGKKVIDQFVVNNTTHKGMLMMVALSDKDGVTELQYNDLGMDIFSSALRSQSPMLKQKMTVVSATIDTLIASGVVKAPNMMKIDVEGAEILVLNGAKALFRNNPPREVLIEIHYNLLPNFDSSMEEVLQFFKNHNYLIKDEIKRKNELFIRYILNK